MARQLAVDPQAFLLQPVLFLSELLLLVLALFAVFRPNVYDGVRHFLFILPALAVLAAFGASWLSSQLPGGRSRADLFLLHEGTRVDITDKAMKGWREIKVGDGREGWIETKAIEEI